MWRIKRLTQRILLALLLVLLGSTGFAPVQADTTAVPSLTISQLKITSGNGQFVTLYNPTNSALNMSNYQLEYFNSFDLTKATSSKLVPLSGVLPPHGYFMVNDSTLQLCYQMTIDSTSLGFSSTAGLVAVLGVSQSTPGGMINSVIQDYVGWSKTATVGAQTLPVNQAAFLVRQPLDSHNNPAISSAGSGNWLAVQPDSVNACSLVSTSSTTPISSGASQLLPATEAPASILSVSAGPTAPLPSIPETDIGLRSPQITELLPNPAGTGNDGSDEFIELYNANDAVFDLTGFILQSGLAATHNYIFPAGTSLAPHSFMSFFASITKLTLSNSGGQVKLVDPMANVIAISDTYGTAPDGQSWALANGTWYWTTRITPSAANIVTQPVAKTNAATTSSKAKATAKPKKVTNRSTKSTAALPKAKGMSAQERVPIHAWELALVAGLALLYGVYEYRHDLANQLHKFRRNPTIGSKDRQPTERR